MRGRLIVATLCLAVAVSGAQELKQQTGTGVVSGRVIDAATGEPLPDSHVYLSTASAPIGYYSTSRDVEVKSDGSFTFVGLPPGRISLSATRDGHLEGQFGQRRPNGSSLGIPLADGETFRDAEIRLWPEASVTGRVSDEAGRPLSGVTVDAWRVGANEWEGGRVGKAGSAQTTPTGDYAIKALSPGAYVIALHATKTTVRAKHPIAGTLVVEFPRGVPSPARVEGQPARSYVSEFFPGGTVADFENPLRLSSGELRSGVDFALRLVATTRVSGRLGGPHTATGADVMLRHPGFPSSYAYSAGVEAATLMEPDGTFTMLDVPPGRYTLYERRFTSNGSDVTSVVEGAWSDRPIEITSQGVRDLVIERPLVTRVRGRVVFHGKPKDEFPSASQVEISVASVGPVESQRYRRGTEAGGTFEIPDVVPGRYLLQAHDALNRSRWRTESMTLDDRDITGQAFDVGNVEMTRFVVTVTATPSIVEGGVYGSDARAGATAAVMAFPADRTRWSGTRSPLMRITRAWNGHFKFDHLPPGEYFVTAMDDAKVEDWPSPSFLERIRSGATRITVKAGQKQVVSLPLR